MGCDREIGNLLAGDKGEGCTVDKEGLHLAFFHVAERRFEFAGRFDVDEHEGQPELACRLVQRCPFKSGVGPVIEIAKDSHSVEARDDFLEYLQSFSVCLQRGFGGDAGHVPTGMREALDVPTLYRVTYRNKYRRHAAG